MIYCLRNVIYGFAILKSPFGMIQILRTTSGDVVLSFIFSKKIVHRRSLFHTPQGVYHRFAQQIYFTVGCAYPYTQPTKGRFLLPAFGLYGMLDIGTGAGKLRKIREENARSPGNSGAVKSVDAVF